MHIQVTAISSEKSSLSNLVWEREGDTFTKGNLSPAFGQIGKGREFYSTSVVSLLPSAQNNLHAKMAYFGVADSDPHPYKHPFPFYTHTTNHTPHKLHTHLTPHTPQTRTHRHTLYTINTTHTLTNLQKPHKPHAYHTHIYPPTPTKYTRSPFTPGLQ